MPEAYARTPFRTQAADRGGVPASGNMPGTAPPRPRPPSSGGEAHQLAAECLKLFRADLDTVEIAARFEMSESKASRLIWAARCFERGQPADFVQRGLLKRLAPP